MERCRECGEQLDLSGKSYNGFCNRSCYMKNKHKDPIFAKAQSERSKNTMLKNHSDPEFIKRRDERLKILNKDIIFQENHSERMRSRMVELNSNPEFRKKLDIASSERMLRLSKDPEFCRIRNEGVSKSITKLNEDPLFRAKSFSYGNSGHYLSIKAGKIHYRSSYELLAYKILDSMEKVGSYLVEPFSIKYTTKERIRRYYPDLLVTYLDGTKELIEVKPSRLVNDSINELKFTAAKEYCLNNNMVFKIWTENNLNINK